MKKVSICIITENNYWLTRYCIENLFSRNSGDVKMEILIADKSSSDNRIVEYGKKISQKHISVPANIDNASAYNLLLNEAKCDTICFFPATTIVNEGWLRSLTYFNDTIERCGLVAISSSFQKGGIAPLLAHSSENLENVWQTEDGVIDGVCLCNGELLKNVGLFDELMQADGFEIMQLSKRAFNAGYKNFYMTEHSSVSLFPKCETKEIYDSRFARYNENFKTSK